MANPTNTEWSKLDHLLIELAYNSQHLSERYEFEESILHEGTHLNNAKRAILDYIEANYKPNNTNE